MTYMIFVNLIVRDLDRAQTFYEGLGFRVDQHSSDEHGSALIVDDKIVVSLVTQDAFAELITGEVGDPSKGTTVVNCLSVASSDEVEDLARKARTLGATTWRPDHADPTNPTESFRDPDGHVWRVTYMEPIHVIN